MSTEVNKSNEIKDEFNNGRGLFFCYSPAMSRHIQSKGLRYVGVGNNVNNGRTFWQFERGADLDAAISEWQANNPNR